MCYQASINKHNTNKTMLQNKAEHKSNKLFKILLLLLLTAMILWIIGQNINVYRYAVVGALFEILWLPMLLTIAVMPFAALYFWYKDQFKTTSKFLYLLLFCVCSVAVLYFLTIKSFD